MTLITKSPRRQERTIQREGDNINILHVGFEVSDKAWDSLQDMIKLKYRNHKVKSRVMRLLVNAVNLGIIDLDKLERQVEEKAKSTAEVIYI